MMSPPTRIIIAFHMPLLLLVLILLAETATAAVQLSEDESVAEYHERGHTWPPLPTDYIPPTHMFASPR